MRFICGFWKEHSWEFPLSILFMRFECTQPDYTIKFVDFQFSLWDSHKIIVNLLARRIFQFSLWDSYFSLFLTRKNLYILSILFMRFSRIIYQSSPSAILPFNSLYEIRIWSIKLIRYSSSTFNSLYEIHNSNKRITIDVYHFQFSLWDSGHNMPGLWNRIKKLSILFMRFRVKNWWWNWRNKQLSILFMRFMIPFG